jgi:hypothetical protein
MAGEGVGGGGGAAATAAVAPAERCSGAAVSSSNRVRSQASAAVRRGQFRSPADTARQHGHDFCGERRNHFVTHASQKRCVHCSCTSRSPGFAVANSTWQTLHSVGVANIGVMGWWSAMQSGGSRAAHGWCGDRPRGRRPGGGRNGGMAAWLLPGCACYCATCTVWAAWLLACGWHRVGRRPRPLMRRIAKF